MTIRKIEPERDSAEIARIYRSYVLESTISFEIDAPSADAMARRLDRILADFPGYVCEEDGKLLGYCYAHNWKDRQAYCKTLETTIYLDPAFTGNGLGRALMEKLIKECRDRGFVSLIACITADNRESCAFHERLGFRRVSYFKSVGSKFGRLLDVVDYQLLL